MKMFCKTSPLFPCATVFCDIKRIKKPNKQTNIPPNNQSNSNDKKQQQQHENTSHTHTHRHLNSCSTHDTKLKKHRYQFHHKFSIYTKERRKVLSLSILYVSIQGILKTQRHIFTQSMHLFEALSHCGNFHEGESPYTNGVMATPETLGRYIFYLWLRFLNLSPNNKIHICGVAAPIYTINY